jgi:hypothetical protein
MPRNPNLTVAGQPSKWNSSNSLASYFCMMVNPKHVEYFEKHDKILKEYHNV